MTTRRFPTDAEVDTWLNANLVDATQPNPLADQLKAASDDAAGRFRATAPYLVAAGRAQWALLDDTPPADDSRRGLRSAARMYLAAASVGIRPLCEHTQQVRPLLIVCDPPVAYCNDCHGPRIDAAMRAIGHQWNHQCDRCGAHTERLTPTGTTGLGHITILGHVCRACADQDRRHAEHVADRVIPVGPRQPCPCGSGRRFKNCCGRGGRR